MAPSVRTATHDDIPALEALIPESVRALSAGYYTPRQVELALVHIFGVDTQLIADGTYYVAEIEGELAGCGGWSRRKTLFGGDQMKSEEDGLLDPATDPARIRAFFVAPRWTRRGVGRELIRTCEEAARHSGFRTMELAATLPGEPLYGAMGYEAVERIAVPMPGDEMLPVIRMRKEL